MRKIGIDDEVYDELAKNAHGFQQPNDVLRRLLRLDEAPTSNTAPSTTVRPGRLVSLLEAGVIAPGDKLVCIQRRKGVRFEAEVMSNGWIKTENGEYAEPSPALRDLVGSQIDGWAYWTHEATGKTLRQLRGDVGGKPRGRRS